MSFRLALIASTLSGFLALSYELVWFRVYGFVTGGSPASFGVVLGAYLLGIAFGSLGARSLCDERAAAGAPERLIVPAWLVLLATVGGWIVPPLLSDVVRLYNYTYTLPSVAVVAALMGAVLPLVAHFGIAADDRAGERVSWLYLANIVGSTTGSLMTGFVLMQYLPTARIAELLALGGVGVTALFALTATSSLRARLKWLAGLGVVSLGFVWATPAAYGFLYEKLLFKDQWKRGEPFALALENRSGVIDVATDTRIFGSGMYDGAFNTDPLTDTNLIVRAYAISAMRASLPDVLMVGLSSGSWAQVIAHAPGVGHLTVIEINPGYSEIDRRFPGVASIFDNPKVTIVYDDGRRWLLAHPDRKFDLVVQNTTWFWRAHITNLLSTEYMQLVKTHLKPGGAFYFNTTWSPAAQRTACSNFDRGFRFINFVAVSDAPLTLDGELWRQRLAEYRIDGRPVLDLAKPLHRSWLAANVPFADSIDAGGPRDPVEGCASILARTTRAPIITDDNMAGEWQRPWDAQPTAGD